MCFRLKSGCGKKRKSDGRRRLLSAGWRQRRHAVQAVVGDNTRRRASTKKTSSRNQWHQLQQEVPVEMTHSGRVKPKPTVRASKG